MANKDGVVSIGFDYKKELDEVCATIEKELNNLGGDINLSDGIKKQMAEVKKMITDMKKDIGSSFDKITETKLDTKTFESFKKDVNKRIREINKEVTTLKEQFSTLDGSANVNGIVQQFANLKKHVEDSNASISEFISNSEKLGKSVIISPNLNTDTLKNDVVEIRKLLTDLNKEDLDFGYANKSTKELTNDLEGLVDKYYRITDLIDEMKVSMNGIDSTTQEYKNQQVQLSKLSLELVKCSAQMDDLFGAKNAEKINVDKITTINSILSKMKELKSQDIENDSIQKLSVDLDGVIAKFDELISTVKTATNALYKIIKQGSVSDLDKQWSSISNKFKSIADESGKINLSKQKTDIKELIDMYQKYENAGGTNSLMSLTDNVETLRKLDKEYQKLNQTQSVDKLNYREYIVTTRYNGTGNGKRDMHSERMSVMARKVKS